MVWNPLGNQALEVELRPRRAPSSEISDDDQVYSKVPEGDVVVTWPLPERLLSSQQTALGFCLRDTTPEHPNSNHDLPAIQVGAAPQ